MVIQGDTYFGLSDVLALTAHHLIPRQRHMKCWGLIVGLEEDERLYKKYKTWGNFTNVLLGILFGKARCKFGCPNNPKTPAILFSGTFLSGSTKCKSKRQQVPLNSIIWTDSTHAGASYGVRSLRPERDPGTEEVESSQLGIEKRAECGVLKLRNQGTLKSRPFSPTHVNNVGISVFAWHGEQTSYATSMHLSFVKKRLSQNACFCQDGICRAFTFNVCSCLNNGRQSPSAGLHVSAEKNWVVLGV